MVKTERHIVYDGLNEWIDHAEKSSDPNGQSKDRSNDRWAGGTFTAVCKLGREGWPEGYEIIQNTTAALFAKVSQKLPVPETVWHQEPTAGVIDMGRLMEGDPECWIETVTTEQVCEGPSHKTVHIVVNVGASWNVPNSVIFTRGAAVVALAEALEMVGRSVQIEVTLPVAGTMDARARMDAKQRVEIRSIVKPFHARANWHVLAFALAHPGMLRRLGFGSMESFSPAVREEIGIVPHGCYGYPCETGKDKGDLYLACANGGDHRWMSANSAEAWILEELKKQGVELTVN